MRLTRKQRCKDKRGWWWSYMDFGRHEHATVQLRLNVWITDKILGKLLQPYAAEVWKTKGTYYAWRVGNAKGAAPTLREAMRTAHAMAKITGGRP